MTKKQFIELTGEDPVDVLGNDWENYVDEYFKEKEDNEYGMTYGQMYEDSR